MPTTHFGKTVELKHGDTKTMVRDGLTAILWTDKINVNILMKMHHHTPVKGDLSVDTL